jgi:hypothetical protein
VLWACVIESVNIYLAGAQLPYLETELRVTAHYMAVAVALGIAYSCLSVIMNGGAGKNGSTVAVSERQWKTILPTHSPLVHTFSSSFTHQLIDYLLNLKQGKSMLGFLYTNNTLTVKMLVGLVCSLLHSPLIAPFPWFSV